MKACGEMISNMAREWKLGLMDQSTRESMPLDASMESGSISGMTVHNTLESGRKIKFQASASTHGWMAASTRESGRAITWRATVTTSGTMEENMKACIRMIKSMGSVSTPGLTADATRAIGGRASSTASAHILSPKRAK
jgi:hypothetical protein